MAVSEPISLTRRVIAPPRPEGENRLLDPYGRVAKDLRVSLTDRCNLRCTYCMPAEGLAWTPNEEMLTDEEMKAMAGIDKKCRLIKGQVFLWPTATDWNDLWDESGVIAGA